MNNGHTHPGIFDAAALLSCSIVLPPVTMVAVALIFVPQPEARRSRTRRSHEPFLILMQEILYSHLGQPRHRQEPVIAPLGMAALRIDVPLPALPVPTRLHASSRCDENPVSRPDPDLIVEFALWHRDGW